MKQTLLKKSFAWLCLIMFFAVLFSSCTGYDTDFGEIIPLLKGIGGMIIIIVVVLLAIMIVSLIMWGVTFIFGWLWSIFGWVVGFGALGGIAGFFITQDSDNAFTWMQYGAGVGFAIGLIRGFKNPIKTSGEGLKDFGGTIKDAQRKSAEREAAQARREAEEYPIELESGLRAKRDPFDPGKLIDQNGQEWRER